MKINESVKHQVAELVEEMILEALENGNAADEIKAMKNSVMMGFNHALDTTGAAENGFASWKF